MWKVPALLGWVPSLALGAPPWGPVYSSRMELLATGAFFAFFIALAIFVSIYSSRKAGQISGWGSELRENLADFLSALPSLLSFSFAPLWLVVGLLLGGARLLGQGSFDLYGCALIFSAHLCWVFLRRQFLARIAAGLIEARHESPMRWVVHGVDLLCLLLFFFAVNAVSRYGVIVNPAHALALCGAVSALAILFCLRLVGARLEATFFLFTMLAFLWVSPFLLTVNYALDLREPKQRKVLALGDCPSTRTGSFTSNGDKVPEGADRSMFEGCEYFYALQDRGFSPKREDKVETTFHYGFLRIEWKRTVPLFPFAS
jgi:hypothetical protein